MSDASMGPAFGRPEVRGWGERGPTARALLGGGERSESLERYGTLAARVLISQIFLVSGIGKVLDPSGTADQMASRGMFWVPFFLAGAIAFELLGGLALLLGYKARLAALALI